MSLARDYEVNACSKDGKFSAKFEGFEVAMGAPILDELRLFVNSEQLQSPNLKDKFDRQSTSNLDTNLNENSARYEQILLSERATACFLFSYDSKFLAFF